MVCKYYLVLIDAMPYERHNVQVYSSKNLEGEDGTVKVQRLVSNYFHECNTQKT